MARSNNKLTRQDQYRLNVAVQQYGDTVGRKTFPGYSEAALHFGKQLALSLTPNNVRGACRTVGHMAIISPPNSSHSSPRLANAWTKVDDACSRIALLESRVAELESLVKS